MEALYQLSYSPVLWTGHVTTRLTACGKAQPPGERRAGDGLAVESTGQTEDG